MKEIITYPDFEKLELLTGKIISVTSPDWSDKLLEFLVDFGPEIGQRTIFAGIKKYYQPEDFKGHTYIFIVNLAEKKMGQGVSQGMMLMVDGPEKPLPIELPGGVAGGLEIR